MSPTCEGETKEKKKAEYKKKYASESDMGQTLDTLDNSVDDYVHHHRPLQTRRYRSRYTHLNYYATHLLKRRGARKRLRGMEGFLNASSTTTNGLH